MRPRSVHVHKVIVVIVSVRSGGVKQAENLSFGGEGEKIETGAPVFAIFSLFLSLEITTFFLSIRPRDALSN